MLKKILSIFTITMLLAAFVYAEEQEPQKNGPRIEVVGGLEHDFGRSKQSQLLKHTFVLKNVGDDTLNIKSVKGG